VSNYLPSGVRCVRGRHQLAGPHGPTSRWHRGRVALRALPGVCERERSNACSPAFRHVGHGVLPLFSPPPHLPLPVMRVPQYTRQRLSQPDFGLRESILLPWYMALADQYLRTRFNSWAGNTSLLHHYERLAFAAVGVPACASPCVGVLVWFLLHRIGFTLAVLCAVRAYVGLQGESRFSRMVDPFRSKAYQAQLPSLGFRLAND
jgi:hypothetical protein